MYPTQSKRYNIGVKGKRLVVRRNVIRERNGDATRGRGLRTNFLDRVAVVGGGGRESGRRGEGQDGCTRHGSSCCYSSAVGKILLPGTF